MYAASCNRPCRKKETSNLQGRRHGYDTAPAEAQETANEPILISEWVWVCLACTYIWSHVEFPDPADAASSGHAGPGHPLVNVCPIMPNLHDPWPVPNPGLSVQSTPQSFRSLVSQAHSLLGRNPTRLLPSKQGRRTCRTSKASYVDSQN